VNADTSGIVDAAAFASGQAGGTEGAAAPVCEASTPGDVSTRSPKAGMSGGQQSPGGSKGGSPGGMGVGVFRSLLRGTNSGSSARMSRSNSGAQPTCLICLEPLTSEDFLVRLHARVHPAKTVSCRLSCTCSARTLVQSPLALTLLCVSILLRSPAQWAVPLLCYLCSTLE